MNRNNPSVPFSSPLVPSSKSTHIFPVPSFSPQPNGRMGQIEARLPVRWIALPDDLLPAPVVVLPARLAGRASRNLPRKTRRSAHEGATTNKNRKIICMCFFFFFRFGVLVTPLSANSPSNQTRGKRRRSPQLLEIRKSEKIKSGKSSQGKRQTGLS